MSGKRPGRRARKSMRSRATGIPRRRRGQNFTGETMVYFPRELDGFAIAPRYRTRMRSTMYGYTSSGAGSGAYAWGVQANSLYFPWNTATWTGLTSLTHTFATLQPTFFSSLCNVNLYQSYRVISSVISVDLLPQSVQDGMTVAIAPTNNLGAVLADMMNQRFTKVHTFGSGRTPPSADGLVNRMAVHKFIGVRKSALEDDLSGSYAGAYNSVPSKLLYWGISLNTGDNAALTLAVEVRIKLSWEVEFYNPVADIGADTLASREFRAALALDRGEEVMMEDLHISLPKPESKCSTT